MGKAREVDLKATIRDMEGGGVYPLALTLEEIAELSGRTLRPLACKRLVRQDRRMIRLMSAGEDEARFVVDSALFRWFIRLNQRLAEIGVFSLTQRQFASQLSRLRRQGVWRKPPTAAVRFGRHLGLVGYGIQRGLYVFPLAHLIRLLKVNHPRLVNEVLIDLARTRVWSADMTESSRVAYEMVKGLFPPAVMKVVGLRQGLSTGRAVTLSDIGESMGVTRERVRQLENMFWRKTEQCDGYVLEPFIRSVFFFFMNDKGRTACAGTKRDAPWKRFVLKVLRVPIATIPGSDLWLYGLDQSHLEVLLSLRHTQRDVERAAMLDALEKSGDGYLVRKDLHLILEKTRECRLQRLRRTGRARIALEAIGRPAHFTEIVRIHNEMFPDHAMSETAMHSALGKGKDGVVWVGLKGTFALRSWGYERPTKKLFDSVAEIVQMAWSETGKPVSFARIVAEMGRYRRLVKPASLVIAAQVNPRVRVVGRQLYAPQGVGGFDDVETGREALDRVFEAFGRTGGRLGQTSDDD